MNILVTALGTMASSCVVKQLRKRKNIFIIGADIYPKEYLVTSNDVDKFIQVSTVLKPKKYMLELVEICKKNKIDFIFPILDEEVELLSKNISILKEIGVTPCVSNFNSIKFCRDKFLTYQKIIEIIPEIAIETMNLKDYKEEWGYPVFVKPKKGRASNGCYKIDTKDDLEYIKRKTKCKNFIIQKYYEGDLITVDIIRDIRNGDIFVLARQELIRNKSGCGTVVKIIKDNNLTDICTKIANSLNFNGVFNVEFIKNKKGYHLIEINPRLSAGTEYSCMAGLDLVNNELNIMLGRKIIVDKLNYNNIYSRRYEAYDTQ